MNRKQISKLIESLKSDKDIAKQLLKGVEIYDEDKELLKKRKISLEKQSIRQKIFGVISPKKQENIKKFIENKDPLSPEIKRETKQVIVDILRILFSLNIDEKKLNNIDIKKEISSGFKNGGNALEFFLMASLYKNNSSEKFEKGPFELEENKIDIIHTTKDKIKFGIQLTTAGSRKIFKKEDDMQKVQYAIDHNGFFPRKQKGKQFYPKTKLNIENFSPRYLPDIPVLLVINSNTSKKVNSKENILLNSYNEWEKNGFDSITPNDYLPKNIKREIDFVAKTYPFIIENFLEIMLDEKKINKMNNFKMNLKNIGDATVSINPTNRTIKFICFPNKGNQQEAHYSMEFYITNKLEERQKIKESRPKLSRNVRKKLIKEKSRRKDNEEKKNKHKYKKREKIKRDNTIKVWRKK